MWAEDAADSDAYYYPNNQTGKGKAFLVSESGALDVGVTLCSGRLFATEEIARPW